MFASRDPQEARHLARIGEDFSAPMAYTAYADWLTPRDEAAARWVRAFAAHLFDGGEAPPGSGGGNAAWSTMLGVGWHPLLRAHADHAAAMNQWVRPVVTLAPLQIPAGVSLPLGTSRFLGSPDLPEGFVWPVCPRGPLRFQAQIDLTDLAHSVATARHGLPREGWLLLFAYDDDGMEGIQPGVVELAADGTYVPIRGLTQVAYLPPDARLERTPIPTQTEGEGACCRIQLGETLDVPVAEDTGDDTLGEIEDLLGQFRGPWSSKLLGWPVHARTSNTSPGPDWQALFTLGSDLQTGWCWCDGEHLDVYVHRDGIRDRTFGPCFGYAA